MDLEEKVKKLTDLALPDNYSSIYPGMHNSILFLFILKRAGKYIPSNWLIAGDPDWNESVWLDIRQDYGPYIHSNVRTHTIKINGAGLGRIASMAATSKKIKPIITKDVIFQWIYHQSLTSQVCPILPENNLDLMRFARLIKPEDKNKAFTELYKYASTAPETNFNSLNIAFSRAAQLLFSDYAAEQAFTYNNWVDLSPDEWTKYFGFPKRFDRRKFFYAIY